MDYKTLSYVFISDECAHCSDLNYLCIKVAVRQPAENKIQAAHAIKLILIKY